MVLWEIVLNTAGKTSNCLPLLTFLFLNNSICLVISPSLGWLKEEMITLLTSRSTSRLRSDSWNITRHRPCPAAVCMWVLNWYSWNHYSIINPYTTTFPRFLPAGNLHKKNKNLVDDSIPCVSTLIMKRNRQPCKWATLALARIRLDINRDNIWAHVIGHADRLHNPGHGGDSQACEWMDCKT